MLISNHKSLAEQLVACDITTVLRKCLSGHSSESMLAIIALTHISNVHKLEKKGDITRNYVVVVWVFKVLLCFGQNLFRREFFFFPS